MFDQMLPSVFVVSLSPNSSCDVAEFMQTALMASTKN